MTLPGFGELTLSGFTQGWLFLFAVVPVAVLALYVATQIRRQRRIRRFTEPDLLDSVAPRKASPWRHLPIVFMVVSLLFLTVALAGPTRDTRIPRNRAVIMLVIDVSPSMNATDVSPTRLAAAQKAAKQFADELAPGVNLGLISFAGNANVLVSPTSAHQATISALDNLRTDNQTATGAALLAALQSISTVGAVISASEGTPPPPARIVVLSDGEENKPSNPDSPQGAYTGARAAKDQGVPISTISFGTKTGFVSLNNQSVPVPVDSDMMKRIAQLSGGQSYTASNIDELSQSYSAVEQQIGYENVPGPASSGWLRLAMLSAFIAIVLAVFINRRLPT